MQPVLKGPFFPVSPFTSHDWRQYNIFIVVNAQIVHRLLRSSKLINGKHI